MIQDSQQTTARRARCLLYGPSFHGKTVAACSISSKFPESLPAKELTHLDDILVIQCDAEGMDSLLGLKLRAPWEDFSSVSDEATLRKRILEVQKPRTRHAALVR